MQSVKWIKNASTGGVRILARLCEKFSDNTICCVAYWRRPAGRQGSLPGQRGGQRACFDDRFGRREALQRADQSMN